MPETEAVTTTVRVVDIVPGDLPAIITAEPVRSPGGRTKLFTQQVQVRDPELFRRLASEISKGDEIQATVVTEWPQGARYFTRLVRYVKVAENAPVITAPA